MPVYNSKTLSNKKMILLCNYKNKKSVNDVINGLLKCQGQLNMKTQDIEPFEVPLPNDKYLEKRMFEVLGQYDPADIFVIVMINYDNDYHPYKLVLSKLAISS